MISIKAFVSRAPEEFFRLVQGLEGASHDEIARGQDNRLRPVLDAIVTSAIESDDSDTVTEAGDALYRIYEWAERARFGGTGRYGLDQVWVWVEIMRHAYVLGAVAIERKRFADASALIEHPIEWDRNWADLLWARHALTMAANSHRFEWKGLVTLAAEEFDREPWFLRPFGVDRDTAIDRLCQFDLLQCIHVMHRTSDPHGPYPSFAHYYNHRVEPIVAKLVTNPSIREAAIPEMSDSRLAWIIVELDRIAAGEAVLTAGWEHGQWQDPRVAKFLARFAHTDAIPT
ncbi:MAG: hypothetical protein U0821_16300 [Chloroflexota bacterium]